MNNTQLYFALSRGERDHLLAVAHLQAGDLPHGEDTQDYVTEGLRGGERPGNVTTYNALESLTDKGLIDRQSPDPPAKRYRLTDDGKALLANMADLFRQDYSARKNDA